MRCASRRHRVRNVDGFQRTTFLARSRAILLRISRSDTLARERRAAFTLALFPFLANGIYISVFPTRRRASWLDSTTHANPRLELSRIIIFRRASHDRFRRRGRAKRTYARFVEVAATALCSYAPDTHRCIAEVASRSRVLSPRDRCRFKHSRTYTHTHAYNFLYTHHGLDYFTH